MVVSMVVNSAVSTVVLMVDKLVEESGFVMVGSSAEEMVEMKVAGTDE